MPQFRRVLDDQQVADVVSFIRKGWGNDAAPTTAAAVAAVRGKTDFVRYKAQILRMQ
jgi:mono/diheme cytochrome c family protein